METDVTSTIDVNLPRSISVRSLVEFVMQSGDLSTGGFQRRDRAQLGTQGHKRVQRSRPEGYETEVEVRCQVNSGDMPLEVRGRIDGMSPLLIWQRTSTSVS